MVSGMNRCLRISPPSFGSRSSPSFSPRTLLRRASTATRPSSTTRHSFDPSSSSPAQSLPSFAPRRVSAARPSLPTSPPRPPPGPPPPLLSSLAPPRSSPLSPPYAALASSESIQHHPPSSQPFRVVDSTPRSLSPAPLSSACPTTQPSITNVDPTYLSTLIMHVIDAPPPRPKPPNPPSPVERNIDLIFSSYSSLTQSLSTSTLPIPLPYQLTSRLRTLDAAPPLEFALETLEALLSHYASALSHLLASTVVSSVEREEGKEGIAGAAKHIRLVWKALLARGGKAGGEKEEEVMPEKARRAWEGRLYKDWVAICGKCEDWQALSWIVAEIVDGSIQDPKLAPQLQALILANLRSAPSTPSIPSSRSSSSSSLQTISRQILLPLLKATFTLAAIRSAPSDPNPLLAKRLRQVWTALADQPEICSLSVVVVLWPIAIETNQGKIVDELWEKMHVETSAGKSALMSQSASYLNYLLTSSRLSPPLLASIVDRLISRRAITPSFWRLALQSHYFLPSPQKPDPIAAAHFLTCFKLKMPAPLISSLILELVTANWGSDVKGGEKEEDTIGRVKEVLEEGFGRDVWFRLIKEGVLSTIPTMGKTRRSSEGGGTQVEKGPDS